MRTKVSQMVTNDLSTDYTDYHRGIHKCALMVSQIGTNDGTRIARMLRGLSLIIREHLCFIREHLWIILPRIYPQDPGYSLMPRVRFSMRTLILFFSMSCASPLYFTCPPTL